MHQSIPGAPMPPPPPGLAPRHEHFFVLDGKFPGVGDEKRGQMPVKGMNHTVWIISEPADNNKKINK